MYYDLNNEQVNKLHKAQNACIRYISEMKSFDLVTPYIRQFGMLKNRERTEYSIYGLSTNIFQNKIPDYHFEKYTTM